MRGIHNQYMHKIKFGLSKGYLAVFKPTNLSYYILQKGSAEKRGAKPNQLLQRHKSS